MQNERRIAVGILAHADAGKTTLAEAMLYLSGKIKSLGRVDRRDSYLDTHSLERERGITIFSKQALLSLPNTALTLLDTPGHADFAAEMERTLQALDCALLIVSGVDGVQAHTETLWRLLRRARIPCFVFVTKMDLPGPGREALLQELQGRLGEGFVDFSAQDEPLQERIALCSEQAMERYLACGSLDDGELRALIAARALFPCFFGSGLRLDGVEPLLEALDRLAPAPQYGEDFSARVFKIARDAQGQRLSYLKLSGGTLRVRQALRYTGEDGVEREEKCTQLRLYSGMKYETRETIYPGEVCAVLGLSATWPGQGLGAEPDAAQPLTEPVLSYALRLPPGTDAAALLPKLRQLDEEDPQLQLRWDERSRELSVRLMGRVQAEIFKRLAEERFDVQLELDAPRILYRETIADTVEGVGHFEPLRHYAEVHLLLQPLPPGSGIVIDSSCPEDALERSWQRLILTHLQEKQHLGVLTGSPLTDVKLTLTAGRAHLKHTEGGDFREASYRAVRQGLMQAESVLLEPWYAFEIGLPAEQIGRAMSDIRAMNGSFEPPEEDGELLRLRGSAPVAELNAYQPELLSYSRGRGRLSLRPAGYRPCRRQQELIEAIGYDAQADPDNTPDSVFCAHGAGMVVKWDKVREYMHLAATLPGERRGEPPAVHRSLSIDERELEAIMEREFGPIRRRSYAERQRNEAPQPSAAPPTQRQKHLIVDGYNLLFASEELKALAQERMDLARGRLMDMLSSYCGYTKAELVLVFDGFRTPGNPGERSRYHNIHVVYTKDGESADAYIERLVDEIGKNYDVRVVTSDNLIRLSALRAGVLRSSSKEFAAELDWTLAQIKAVLQETNRDAHTTRLKDGKA